MLWKVITVDDELLVRNHLRSLIEWERYGFTLSGEAGEGAEALRLAEELSPQLAIVDMNMPGMDGVELVRRLSERHPLIQIVALSSFDSYDYVRGSLSYGAVDYLRKHRLTPESLIQVLDKVRVRLQEGNDRQKEKEKWETAGPAVSQSYFKELLIGASSDQRKYRDHFQDMPYGRDGQQHVLVLLKLLQFDMLLSRMKEQELALFIRSVVDVCVQILGESGCAVYMERGTFALLLSMENDRSENGALQKVAGRVSRIEKSLELYFNASAVFLQSGIFRSLDSLAVRYSKLQSQLDELQGYKPGDSAADGEPVSYISISQEKELLAAAEACDAEAIARIVGEVIRTCSAGGVSYRRAAGRLSAELMQIAAKIAQKRGLKSDWIFQEMATPLRPPESFKELEAALLPLFGRLVDELRETHLSLGYSRHVAHAIQAIQTYYREGLTLEETAERLGITPAYLSRLFKEETGSTFTEALTAYRIERSCQLIRTKTGAVKDIYREVGFNSYSYFIKVFKEHIGETPHVYASRYGK